MLFGIPRVAPVPGVAVPDVVGVMPIFIWPATGIASVAPYVMSVYALATGVDATERTPAVNADTATTAMRCFIVFVDICFLSLVELGAFPISARRSC